MQRGLIWLLGLSLHALAWAGDQVDAMVTPQWAEHYLQQQHPELLLDQQADHVVSYYFFGRWQDVSLIGLERVRGEQYRQYLTLLLFRQHDLFAYYANVATFPRQLSLAGEVQFPDGVTPDAALWLSDLPPQLCWSRQSLCSDAHFVEPAAATANEDPAVVDRDPPLDDSLMDSTSAD